MIGMIRCDKDNVIVACERTLERIKELREEKLEEHIQWLMKSRKKFASYFPPRRRNWTREEAEHDVDVRYGMWGSYKENLKWEYWNLESEIEDLLKAAKMADYPTMHISAEIASKLHFKKK